MSVKRIVLCYENRAGKLHEVSDFWIDDYAHPEELERELAESLNEFIETEGVFRDDPDADD